jgi:hypothetical protein
MIHNLGGAIGEAATSDVHIQYPVGLQVNLRVQAGLDELIIDD